MEESWMALKVNQGLQSLGGLALAEIYTQVNHFKIIKKRQTPILLSSSTVKKAMGFDICFHPLLCKIYSLAQQGNSKSAIRWH